MKTSTFYFTAALAALFAIVFVPCYTAISVNERRCATREYVARMTRDSAIDKTTAQLALARAIEHATTLTETALRDR